MRRIYTICIIMLLAAAPAFSQARGAVEQYHYVSSSQPYVYMPIVHFNNNRQWHAEARYNYEELKTFSFYLGKTFERDSRFSYSFTPLLGGAVGKFNGFSTGLNMDMSYEQFFFSAQSQYSFSADHYSNNFLYSWSEIGYQSTNWLFSGISLQQTHYQASASEIDPGAFIGFSYREYTLPVYAFNPLSKKQYFIVGLVVEWSRAKPAGKKHVALPVVKNDN